MDKETKANEAHLFEVNGEMFVDIELTSGEVIKQVPVCDHRERS